MPRCESNMIFLHNIKTIVIEGVTLKIFSILVKCELTHLWKGNGWFISHSLWHWLFLWICYLTSKILERDTGLWSSALTRSLRKLVLLWDLEKKAYSLLASFSKFLKLWYSFIAPPNTSSSLWAKQWNTKNLRPDFGRCSFFNEIV